MGMIKSIFDEEEDQENKKARASKDDLSLIAPDDTGKEKEKPASESHTTRPEKPGPEDSDNEESLIELLSGDVSEIDPDELERKIDELTAVAKTVRERQARSGEKGSEELVPDLEENEIALEVPGVSETQTSEASPVEIPIVEKVESKDEPGPVDVDAKVREQAPGPFEATVSGGEADRSVLLKTADAVRNMGLAWSAGVALFGSVIFMLILGWFADLVLGTEPWGIVAGIAVGSLIGFFQLFRITSQIKNPKPSDFDKVSLLDGGEDLDSDDGRWTSAEATPTDSEETDSDVDLKPGSEGSIGSDGSSSSEGDHTDNGQIDLPSQGDPEDHR